MIHIGCKLNFHIAFHFLTGDVKQLLTDFSNRQRLEFQHLSESDIFRSFGNRRINNSLVGNVIGGNNILQPCHIMDA